LVIEISAGLFADAPWLVLPLFWAAFVCIMTYEMCPAKVWDVFSSKPQPSLPPGFYLEPAP
jgi:hypothetical protein